MSETGKPAAPTILCVDDETGILNALKRILRSEPVRVLTAPGGSEGLEVLRQNQVNLLLTDYRMAGMTGVQFLEEASVLCPEAFRILLTGYADFDAVSDAINKVQIYKIIYKPWNDEDLRLTIRSALAHYARNQENALLQKELATQNQQLQALTRQLEVKLTDQTGKLEVYAGSLMTAQRILNQLPYAILGLDETGQMVFANETAEAWFGRAGQADTPKPRLLGGWAQDHLPEPILRLIADAWKDNPAFRSPIETRVKDGQLILVGCRRIETTDGQGRPAVVGVLVHAHTVNDGKESPRRPPQGGDR